MTRKNKHNTLGVTLRSCLSWGTVLVGVALSVPAASAIEVIYQSWNTTVTTGYDYSDLEFENPLSGDETVQGHHVWQWLDADYHGPGSYEDWSGNDPNIEGCSTEVWLRQAGQEIETTATTPGRIISIHLNGDANDGIAQIYVWPSQMLVAEIDMGTSGGSEQVCVYVDCGTEAIYTIRVADAGPGQYGGDDVAVFGAAVLADTGLCCLPGGDDCADLQELECLAQGGDFWGEGTYCPYADPGIDEWSVCEGSYVEIWSDIHVYAGPDANLLYGWFRNGEHLYDTTEPRLIINSVALGHTGDYSCTLYYPCGSLTNDICSMTVLPNVDILQQPMETFGCIGQPVSFEVLAAGLEPLEYQWYFEGYPIPDANQPIFDIPEVVPEDEGLYYVKVTQANGCWRTSDAAYLTVYDIPQFIMQPLSQYVLEGEAVSLGVEIDPLPDYTLVWRLDGMDIPDAFAETYDIPAASADDAGVYDVHATNQCGDNFSDPAALTVRYPKWLQRPTENPAYPGYLYGWNEPTRDDVGPIACDDWLCVDGRAITSVHWWGSYTNGWMEEHPPALPMAGFAIGIWTDVPAGIDRPWSHPGSMLKRWEMPVGRLQERYVGVDYHPDHGYEAYFRYDFYAADGDFFTQDPNSQDVYWVSIAPTYVCPCVGDVNQDGLTDNGDIDPFIACQGQDPTGPCAYADINCDGVIDTNDYDPFVCLISGGQNCCPSTDPPVPYHPWGIKTRRPAWNDAAVMMTAPLTPDIGAQFGDGLPIENYEGRWDLAFILSSDVESTPQACCIPGVGCVEIEPEECVSQGGQPMGPGTVCSDVLPEITAQPVSLTIPENRPAMLIVSASGAPPLYYQWRLGGSDIPDANSDTYTVESMSAEHIGDYDVVVSNNCGTVVSDAATLDMWPVGDLNCDLVTDVFDIGAFVLAITDTDEYAIQFPTCDRMLADCDLDGTPDVFDIDAFVAIVVGE
ncbi:MAG: hypothetical protein JXO22_02675 [Phycisphaerae bacterium]|nr:hypothetical protein [Phycisphaerae bacterium]